MPENTIYQLDLAALRGYNRALAERFPESGVTLRDTPYWSRTSETLMVTVENDDALAIVPCDWLTPNPSPTFRFIVTAANGNPISDETVQGIPIEYADYAPILLREGFEWVGINYGSQRVSIERVNVVPPVGENAIFDE